jgi:hypothetical protein
LLDVGSPRVLAVRKKGEEVKDHALKNAGAQGVPALNAGASALTLALYALTAPTSGHAAPIAVDIDPDVTLGSFGINIGTAQYSFTRVAGSGGEFENQVNTGSSRVVGFVVPPDAPAPAKPGTYADALAANEIIDASRTTVSGNAVVLAGLDEFLVPIKNITVPVSYGEFFDTNGAMYAGLSFDLPDGVHFGWVEIAGVDGTLTLSRYGYECSPNTGILAGAGSVGAACDAPATPVPEPATLALLVAGAAGVLALRRRQRARA